MKPSTKINSLLLIGMAFMMLSVFAEPLGIPPGFDCLPMLVAIVLFYWGYRAGKKARAAGQIPPTTDTQKRKQFIRIMISTGVACIALPFILPYTGIVLPFGVLVAISIFSFFVCIGAYWFGQKMQK